MPSGEQPGAHSEPRQPRVPDDAATGSGSPSPAMRVPQAAPVGHGNKPGRTGHRSDARDSARVRPFIGCTGRLLCG